MPPVPPNLAKHTILRTTPSWEQRHFARKDNVTRFITHRFPNKPRDDPGLANPPLPPGASRLAFHKGSTRPGSNFSRSDFQWVAVAELPRLTSPGGLPITLAISEDIENSETIAVGYPKLSGAATISRFYSYNESTKTLTPITNNGVDADPIFSSGSAIAISGDKEIVLIGSRNLQNGQPVSFDNAGQLFAGKLQSSGIAYSRTADTYYEPETSNLLYGSSASISDLDTENNRYYSTAGVPGVTTNTGAVWVVSFQNSGAFAANIANDILIPTLFKGLNTNDNFGISSDISNLVTEGTNRYLYVVASASDFVNLNTYVRVLVGSIESGDDVDTPTDWNWNAPPSIYSVADGSVTSVAMTSDGTMVILGDQKNNRVQIYQSTDKWATSTQVGQTITGAASTFFGSSVAIDRSASANNIEGTTIVIGQPEYSTPIKPNCGRVIVMEYMNGAWQPALNPVIGENENEQLGTTLAMRNNNSFVAAGSHTTQGRVALFKVRDLSAT